MNRNRLSPIIIATFLLLLSAIYAWGGDTSMLRPPKGSRVALVVFEDLQCPDCARAAPLLHEAAKKYNIPLVQYDFPLPMHNWSFEAAVNARYFDTKSKTLGDDYRLFIFHNQPQITPQNLRGMTERFAADHKVSVPSSSIPRVNSPPRSRPITPSASAWASSIRPPSTSSAIPPAAPLLSKWLIARSFTS